MGKNRVFTVCLISVLVMLVGQLYYLLNSPETTDFFEMLIYLFGIPVVLIFLSTFIIGLIVKKRKVMMIYSLIFSVVFSMINNILPLLMLSTETINHIVDNTDISESVTITVNAGSSVGQVLSTIFIYVVISTVGGLAGVWLGRRGDEQNVKN